MQLIVREIFAVVAMVDDNSLELGEGVVLKATKKKESESRENIGGFGRVSYESGESGYAISFWRDLPLL